MRPLRQALRLWQDTNARYEAARTRVLLARAYSATGDADGAKRELGQAGSVFDQLGARGDAARVDALLGRAGTRVTMTFVFTDIVDSTRHLEHLGDANWQKLLRGHDELIARITTAEGGTVVDHTGDGFFLAFPTAERAVTAAVAIQREAAGNLPFELRIGVHTAEATSLGDNYRGKGVHVAARIRRARLRRGDRREPRDRRSSQRRAHGRDEERAAEGDLRAGRRRVDRLARRQLGARRTLRRAREPRRCRRRS